MNSHPTPEQVEAALALHHGNLLVEAEKAYAEILQLDPRHAEALHMLGALKLQQGDVAAAIALMERALENGEAGAKVHANLGAAYRESGDSLKAVAACRRAIDIDATLANAHLNLGHALRGLGNLDPAAAAYEAYLRLRPKDVVAHLTLGDTHRFAGRLDEAIDCYETALVFDPNAGRAHATIVEVLRQRGWFHAAVASAENGIKAAPREPDMRMNHAFGLLQFGDFKRGWEGYDARFEKPIDRIFLRSTPPPYWTGENLAGKSIIVWTEQGVGDEVLFASIIPDLLATAKKCVIECRKRIAPVFARSFPTAEVVGYEEHEMAVTPAEGFDFQAPLGDLGKYFRPDLQSFPAHTGYLRADAEKVSALRHKYKAWAGDRKLVGLSWLSLKPGEGKYKSAKLTELAPILRTPGVAFVNLQYGDCSAELSALECALGIEVFNDTEIDSLRDMEEYFAQVAAMDLVLTTSNTAAHVAGSQNIPVWIMLPYARGLIWYWFLGRKDCPWYPSARLFRQQSDHLSGSWVTGVVNSVAKELSDWSGSSGLARSA